ncbi:MAG: hypothetical protein EBT33_20240 [Betaproteobacteria bacterium]|nr:hypothetical protein [Betaproteobacteria bacterium]
MDTTTPAAPAADVAAASDTGSSNSDNVTSDTTPTISGTGATPGDTIKIRDGGGTVIATAIVQSDGSWSATLSSALPDGSTTLSVTATDAAGNEGAATSVPIAIDSAAPATPTVNATTSNTLSPVLSGTAVVASGESLRIAVNGAIFSVVPNAQGAWSLDLAQASPVSGTLAAFVDGLTYSVTATVTDTAGNSASDTTQSELLVNTNAPDTTAPAAPILTSAADNAGAQTGSLSTGATTDDSTPTLVFTAEAGAIVAVYDGTTLLGTATEGPSGRFTFTPATALADGAHSFTAIATDAANNSSAASTAFAITVDTTAPSAPSAVLDAASDSGTQGDRITSDTTPTLSGTGTAGDTITVKDAQGNVIATATVQSNGSWSATPLVALPEGVNTLSCRSRSIPPHRSRHRRSWTRPATRV